ncbi:MAG: DUF2397 family protein [Actinobacteria bacterium]|nr:DUF2397 family protein [Actinomycetota bacterium]
MDRADEDEARAWPAAGTPGRLAVASYLTAPAGAAAQYRLIVDALLDEQTRSLAGVSRSGLETLLRNRAPEPLTGRPPGGKMEPLPLSDRLDQLVAWGVAVTWPGPADEPWYQLSADAARLHTAVQSLGPDAPAARPGASAAASAAPPVLAAQLARLAEAIPGDPAAATQAWSALRTTLAAMTEAAAAWRAGLAAAQAGAPDPARVAARQDALRRYLDVWGGGVDRHGPSIAAQAAQLLEAGPPAWRPAALHSLGAAVPDDRLAALLDDYRATLNALLTWFGPGDNAARRLRRQLRDVLLPLTGGHRSPAAVRGQLSARADLLALAGALERSPSDDAAWSLWSAATGLFAARHLPHPTPQPAGPAGAVSFWTAEPAPVTAALGSAASAADPGPRPGTEGPVAAQASQVARLTDRSAARAAARAAFAAEQVAAGATEQAIQARSGLRLSAWTGLDAAQLDVLLSFLAVLAGARPGPDGSRTIRTPDGRWTVRADPTPDGAPPPAVIRTPAGQLIHPDLRLTITTALPALAGNPR